MRRWALLLAAALPIGASEVTARPAELKVCADPNNLPFSDVTGAGFENELAKLLASDRKQTLVYTWWAQRRGALRNTLKAGICDVLLGVPNALAPLGTTRPYYTSSYVFVTREERDLRISSFDDPRLRDVLIGVQVVGDDYNNTPPVHALSRRGIVNNVRGYSVLGDYGEAMPAAPILRAVEQGEVDLAIVWGPLAGYYARHATRKLRLTPTPASDGDLPLHFAISMGIRRSDLPLQRELDAFIVRRRSAIDAILERYGVPRQ
jgi:mxaJ protein